MKSSIGIFAIGAILATSAGQAGTAPPTGQGTGAATPLPPGAAAVASSAAGSASAAPNASARPAAAPAAASGAGTAPPPGSGKVSGVSIYGAYLMRHTVNEDGSAEAHFSPPLPLDNRLLAGAMQSVARVAFGQHGIEIKDPASFMPKLGAIVTEKDLEYEYRFIFDGTPKKGVGLILVQRKALPPPAEDPELLKELEKL